MTAADAYYADVRLEGDLHDVSPAVVGALDLLGSLLYDRGYRVTVEIDPGTRITATPPRQQPSEAPMRLQQPGRDQ